MNKPRHNLALPCVVGLFYDWQTLKTLTPIQIIQLLDPYLSSERKRRISEVIQGRTRTVVPVLDRVCDLGNINAVLRSAEALGFDQIEIIESGDGYKTSNRASQGTDKWLTMRKWQDPARCLEQLKQDGYRIYATHLSPTAVPIHELDFTQKCAVVLGNEKEGVGAEVLQRADATFMIPMYGFAQSFNISVAAALCFNHIASDRMRRQGRHGDLSPEAREELQARYFELSVPSAEPILERLVRDGAAPRRQDTAESPNSR
ncbi:MAG: TrmH family RNA methyltransferase [Bacteriovoracia bacterium]